MTEEHSTNEVKQPDEMDLLRWFTKHGPALLIGGILLSLFLNIWGPPLFDLDEGIYAAATREMMERGDWMTPYVNGEPFFEKPIFMYWMQLLATAVFGMNEFALRLPSALFGILWVLATYWFVRRFRNKGEAFLAAFLMLTSIQFTIVAKAAVTDSFLNAFLVLAMYFGYLAGEEKKRRYAWACFLFSALGVLAKGPIAILIPGAVSFLFYLWKKDLKSWLKLVTDPLGILIFFAIASPWYIHEYLVHGQDFIEGFFIRHNVSRFREGMQGHVGSMFYYVPVMFFGMFPHAALLCRTLVRIRQWFKTPFLSFCAFWFLFILIFFSFSATKLPHYLLAGITPLCALIAAQASDLRSKPALLIPTAASLALFAGFPQIARWVQPLIRKEAIQAQLDHALDAFGPIYYASLALAVLALVLMLVLRQVTYKHCLVGSAMVFLLVVNTIVINAYAEIAQEPFRKAGIAARENDWNIKRWRLNHPSILFYAQRHSEKVSGHPAAGDIVITNERRLKKVKQTNILFEYRGIVIAEVLEP